jgi:hypothetical protein
MLSPRVEKASSDRLTKLEKAEIRYDFLDKVLGTQKIPGAELDVGDTPKELPQPELGDGSRMGFHPWQSDIGPILPGPRDGGKGLHGRVAGTVG